MGQATLTVSGDCVRGRFFDTSWMNIEDDSLYHLKKADTRSTPTTSSLPSIQTRIFSLVTKY